MFIQPIFTALLLAAQPAQSSPMPAATSAPELSLQSRTLLRCSAAFAMVAHGQSIGNEAAQKWPDLDTKGREFFVRSLAQLMDGTGLDRPGITALINAEAQRMWDTGEVDEAMPACLLMLNASGV